MERLSVNSTKFTEGFRRIDVGVLRRPSLDLYSNNPYSLLFPTPLAAVIERVRLLTRLPTLDKVGDLKVTLINQVYHHPDFVELVHVDFVFLLLARHNQSKLCFCTCFVRRFGIAHASTALRSLNHNLYHHIFLFGLALGNHKSERHESVPAKRLVPSELNLDYSHPSRNHKYP